MGLTNQRLKLKKVGQEDCELLWKWANDPVVRAASFSSEPITWEEHLRWFNKKLNSSSCYHFIAFNDQDEPIGQIRFDVDEQLQAEVDVSIDSKARGKGYASDLIKLSIKYLFEDTNIKIINAVVRSENIISIKSFRRSGFDCVSNNKFKNNYSIHHYIYARC